MREIASLSPYTEQPFKLSFFTGAVHGYDGLQSDGMFVDDVEVFRLVDGNGPTTAPDEPPGAPLAFGLRGVAPNPSAGPVTLTFATDRPGRHRLLLLDVLGREVAVLAEGAGGPGVHTVRWDGHGPSGRAVAPGAYLARLEAAGRVSVRSLTRLR